MKTISLRAAPLLLALLASPMGPRQAQAETHTTTCTPCASRASRSPAIELPSPSLFFDSPVDLNLTPETAELLDSLRPHRRAGILFGHHASTQYGLESTQGSSRKTWKNDGVTNLDRSDVKTGTGSHAALLGVDIEDVMRAPLHDKTKSDEVELTRNILAAARRGQVVTVSWHAHDPVNPEWNYREFADRVSKQKAAHSQEGPPTAEQIVEADKLKVSRCDAVLRNPEVKQRYRSTLARMAAFFHSLRDVSGRPIPLLFRPFHEQTGNWFWWGKGHCAPEDFSKLWQMTVTTLRDEHQVHNLIYVYSPNQKPDTLKEYYQGYPGDRFVDVLALDAYHDLDTEAGAEKTGRELGWIVREARAQGKVAALAETGLESFRTGPYGGGTPGEPNPHWFSKNLGHALKSDPDAAELAYIMVWRNGSENHHYFPAPWETETLEDFDTFRAENDVILLNELRAARSTCGE
jgi:mannan endo-1,4-beta-mannosidase